LNARSIVAVLAVAATFALLPAALPAAPAFDLGDELAHRVDGTPGYGLVAGTIDRGQTSIVVRGESGSGVKLDRDTVFEIGSITKAFTAMALADMVRRGEVGLNDPIEKFLPSGVTAPFRGDRHITLLDLATQSSGLPRSPSNLMPARSADPYAEYTEAKLYDFLSHYTLPRDPGASYEYSNLGVGLLGVLLANRAKLPYEALVRERVLRPLGMESTAIALRPGMAQRFAPGHDADGDRVENTDLNALAGAGGLRSSLDDMLKFLAANMANSGPLADDVRAAQEPRRDAASPEDRIGLVWHTLTKSRILWHNGQTAGYHSFIGISSDRTRGIVILSNVGESIDDIGFHWLDPSIELTPPRRPLALDPKLLSRYTGSYVIGASALPFVITLEGGKLYARLAQQRKARIYPYAPNQFFYKAVDAQITFRTDANGKATDFVLHQNGRDTPGKRVDSAGS
jgi:D-alanyl-D-alanine-carboxypeptidase/D-alanyl-D-alanine-endopeptidase